jgi:hypothetical protein
LNEENETMASSLRQCVRIITACCLAAIFAVPPSLLAQTHIVSPAELQKETVRASTTRQQNLNKLSGLLTSSQAQRALAASGVNIRQVTSAMSSLNDQELARLAARADKAQADFAAGRIDDHDLLIILIAIAALILIIVAVHH